MITAIVYMQGNQIVVLPDGTLVDIVAILSGARVVQPNAAASPGPAVRSKRGQDWGAPNKIAPLGTVLLTNPDIPNPTSLDETVRAGDYLPDVAVDQATGAIYMVFADGRSAPASTT